MYLAFVFPKEPVMEYPNDSYCDQLLDRYAVPEPIRRHCAKVAEVGSFLALQMSEAGVMIDVDLVRIGCRVHDAFKVASLPALVAKPEWGYEPSEREIAVWRDLRSKYADMHETLVAAEMFREEFPEFSEFVALIGSTGNPTYLDASIELKVLHYADWRVQFDQIASFDDRLAYLRETYQDKWIEKGADWWEQTLAREKQLEAELFELLPFQPDDLETVLKEDS